MAQKVLIADDSIASQRLLEMVLTRGGYNVVTVGSGVEVIDRVKEKQPDIALIDAVMPEVDGYQICETLKQTPDFKNLPIILLAGKHEEVDQEKGSKLVGKNAILTKPAKSTVILSKVKELLAQHEAVVAEQSPVEPALAPEVIEEPPMVAEAYDFDEDSEELDMLVEDEILEEGAEFEEEIEMEEPSEEIEMEEPSEEIDAAGVEPEEASWEEEPAEVPTASVAETAQESIGTVKLSDEKLDMIANEIAQRVAKRLVPALVLELTKSFMQVPMVKSALEEAGKKMVKDLLPEIRKNL